MRALRLVLEAEGGTLRLVSREEVDTAVLPTDALSGYEGQSGTWIEVQDAGGTPLYRRVIATPEMPEVFTDDPTESIRRVPAAAWSPSVVVVVPFEDAARRVVVFGSSTGEQQTVAEPRADPTAQPVLSFDMGDPGAAS